MTALLDINADGRANLAYRGQTPWHGCGTQIDHDASIDEWRVAAGLDWDVKEFAIEAVGGPSVSVDATGNLVVTPQRVAAPGYKALIRDGAKPSVLSVVSERYHVVQPREVLEFFRDLVAANGFRIETAGVLDHGRRVWALARIPDQFELPGRDVVIPYCLLATSYDKTLATQATLTSVRVVCNNTLTAADRAGNNDTYRVPHVVPFKVGAAKAKLGLDLAAWSQLQADAALLAARKVTLEEALVFFAEVHAPEQIERDDGGRIVKLPEPNRVVKNLVNAYRNAPGAQDTAWGLVNAVTFYQDHVAPASASGDRFASAQFGGGARRKARAVDLALALAA